MKLRRAVPKDRKAILEIASLTWEGWDYVPMFLDEWIAEGGLYVVEQEEEIIGMTKTTEISPGELWLEAIRVAQKHRNRGLGREIAAEQLKLTLAANPKSIRLSTADVNTASLKIIRHLGFREYAVFDYYALGGIPSYDKTLDFERVKQLGEDEENKKAWQLVRQSEEYIVSKGLLPHTWKFSEWTEGLFRTLVSKKYVYATHDRKGVLVLLPNRYSPASLEIAFLDGDEESVKVLGNFALKEIGSAAEEDVRTAGFAAGDRKREIFTMLGIKPREDLKKVYVFDYPLGKK